MFAVLPVEDVSAPTLATPYEDSRALQIVADRTRQNDSERLENPNWL
jgi:hypothetical protein